MRVKNARVKYRMFVLPLMAEELEVRTLFSVAAASLSVVYVPSDGTTDSAPTNPGVNGSESTNASFTGSVSETFIVALPAGTAQGEWVVDASTGNVLKQDPNGGAGAGLCTINVTGDPAGNLLMVVSPDKVSFVVMEDAAPLSTASLPEAENTVMASHTSLQVNAPVKVVAAGASSGSSAAATAGSDSASGEAITAAFTNENLTNASLASANKDIPHLNSDSLISGNSELDSNSPHEAVAPGTLETTANGSQKVVDDPGMFEGEFTVLAKAPLPKQEPGAPADENDAYAAVSGKGSTQASQVHATGLAMQKAANADATKDGTKNVAAITENKSGNEALALQVTSPASTPEAPQLASDGLLSHMTRVNKWWKAAAFLSLATGLYVGRNDTMNRTKD